MRRIGICALALVSAGAFTPSTLAATPATQVNGRIAYSIGAVLPDPDPSGHSQVYTVNPGGSDTRQLTHLTAPNQAGDPSYSPDGRRILYVSNASGRYQVWLMRADGSRQRQLVVDPGHDAFIPRWSPDGTHLTFTRCSWPFKTLECTVATTRTDGSHLRNVTGGHTVDWAGDYSPDGRSIAFSSNRANIISAVWRTTPQGAPAKRLTKPDLEAFWPDYAPSGSRMLVTDNNDRPINHLRSMRPDGTGIRTLVEGGFGRYSPDGTHIVFAGGANGAQGLSTANADGTHAATIVPVNDLVLADWGPQS